MTPQISFHRVVFDNNAGLPIVVGKQKSSYGVSQRKDRGVEGDGEK